MTDADTPTPRCALCNEPFLPEQDGQKYCSARHRRTAEKRRQQDRKKYGGSPGEVLASPTTTVASLAELYAATGGPELNEADLADGDPRQYSDFGELPGDVELATAIDERDARFQKMLAADGASEGHAAHGSTSSGSTAGIRASSCQRSPMSALLVPRQTRPGPRPCSGTQPHSPRTATTRTRDSVQIRASESRHLNKHRAKC